jgi:(E)-4-hydroxy-3-methylbut-2-enyl-diphosphate synthase
VDILKLARQVEEALQLVTEPIRVAVMGCEVNGPGESRDADVGVAGGVGWGSLFRHGRLLRRVPEHELLTALMAEVAEVLAERRAGAV